MIFSKSVGLSRLAAALVDDHRPAESAAATMSGAAPPLAPAPGLQPRRSRRPALPETDELPAVGRLRAGGVGNSAAQPGRWELALCGVVPPRFPAWQLLYRSCDLLGAPQAAVTTVVLPCATEPTATRPVLSYQCAIDAIGSRWLPSYALQRGAETRGCAPQLELLLIASALARGWAVSIPDHDGLTGNWGAPRESGYRVLDGIRAALQFAPLGLEAASPIGPWGYSGGGLATSWAAEMAPGYPPDLDIVGAAIGAPVGDSGSTSVLCGALAGP